LADQMSSAKVIKCCNV